MVTIHLLLQTVSADSCWMKRTAAPWACVSPREEEVLSSASQQERDGHKFLWGCCDPTVNKPSTLTLSKISYKTLWTLSHTLSFQGSRAFIYCCFNTSKFKLDFPDYVWCWCSCLDLFWNHVACCIKCYSNSVREMLQQSYLVRVSLSIIIARHCLQVAS